jgi:hypothetical protein
MTARPQQLTLLRASSLVDIPGKDLEKKRAEHKIIKKRSFSQLREAIALPYPYGFSDKSV